MTEQREVLRLADAIEPGLARALLLGLTAASRRLDLVALAAALERDQRTAEALLGDLAADFADARALVADTFTDAAEQARRDLERG
jgi:hypothetical protein